MSNTNFIDPSKIKNTFENPLKYQQNNLTTDLYNFLTQKINDLTLYYGDNFSPFVNGKYIVFMINGTWYERASTFSSLIEYTSNLNNLNMKNFHFLATDIDVPEPSKEYINVSSRSQTITHYQRELIMPDFNISYIEDKNLTIMRYHEYWFKAIEMYRRGKISISDNEIYSSTYFYQVPYTNAIFILIFDIKYQVRGLIYLVGVKPVSLPLKQVIGNRSGAKMTVYNIQYKLTNMYYKFFKDNSEFGEYIKSANNSNSPILAKLFKKQLLSNNSNS